MPHSNTLNTTSNVQLHASRAVSSTSTIANAVDESRQVSRHDSGTYHLSQSAPRSRGLLTHPVDPPVHEQLNLDMFQKCPSLGAVLFQRSMITTRVFRLSKHSGTNPTFISLMVQSLYRFLRLESCLRLD